VKFIATSDWHLSARPKDAYRWEIFPWLTRQLRLREVEFLFVLGDLTDFKDHHANAFINKMVDSFRKLHAESGAVIYLLAGNHDYVDPNYPLLRFLNEEGVLFCTQPLLLTLRDKRIYLIPNQKSQVEFWNILESAPEADFILMHQTVRGSLASNGMKLQGLDPERAKKGSAILISGDVHVPQKIGGVTYCGSPHPVHFGDNFKPRVLFWDGVLLKSIPRTTLKKAVLRIRSVKELSELEALTPGDQVKVILELPRSEFSSWEEKRTEIHALAKKQEWEVHGLELREQKNELRAPQLAKRVTPAQMLKAFCKENKIESAIEEIGLKLLETAHD
jgi:DNA repair exonuclease SbcCD nuclease subunit